MKRKPLLLAVYLCLTAVIILPSVSGQRRYTQLNTHYKARVQDAFWSPKYAVWDAVTAYDVLNKFEGRQFKTAAEKRENNVFSNFDQVAAGKKGTGHHAGSPWFDGLIYESIRGIGDLLAMHPDPKLKARVDGYIDRIYAAQKVNPEGYLDTYTDLMEPSHRWGDSGGLLRYQHDVYNAGMLIEAGVHYYKATGETKLLKVATRLAGDMTRIMGPAPKRNIVPAHSGPEEALMKLYWLFKSRPELKKEMDVAVNEDAYFALTQFWIENRGHHVGYPLWKSWGNDSSERWIKQQKYKEMDTGSGVRPSWGEYAQDKIPVFRQTTIEGHAVRATLLGTGIAAVALENHRPEYIQTANRFWDNMVGRRMFITGGVGAVADDEKFGPDYYLPTDAYLETCAAVGAGFFSQRMNELTGDGKYMDAFERSLYNNVLTGISLSGDQYTYQNPLNAPNHSRWSWHSCPCCPPMFLKMVSSLPDYIYATVGSTVYVNMFMGSKVSLQLKDETSVDITQKTNYPWKGQIHLTVDPQKRAVFSLKLRIPGWARGIENPFGLYQADGGGQIKLMVNGQVEKLFLEKGYASIKRTWKKGDQVTLELPMKPRFVTANQLVKEVNNKVAIACGPIVYCLEKADNNTLEQVSIDTTAPLQLAYQKNLLKGVNVITGKTAGGESFTAIPYYAAGNRKKKGYKVWLPVAREAHIQVNSRQVENKVSRLIYGSNLEDVNNEIYGGLYDQRIFGESFEEPSTGVNFNEWRKFSGWWTAEKGALTIIPSRGTTSEVQMHGSHKIGIAPDYSAKLIYQPLDFTSGSVQSDIRFTGKGQSGALLVKVNNAAVGDDAFNGYEISLSRDGKKVAVGKHKNDYHLIKEAPVNFDPSTWNTLKVNFEGSHIEVLLNNKAVLSCVDEDSLLLHGKVGLRTWHSSMEFRNVKVQNDHKIRTLILTNEPQDHLSYRWDVLRSKSVSGLIELDSTTAYNGHQSQVIVYTGDSGNLGVANRGLNRWGIAVRDNQAFQGRVYLKGKELTGPVTVALQSADGKSVYAQKEIHGIGVDWKKFKFTLVTDAADPQARLAIYLSSKGKVWIDQAVLMSTGKDQFKGLPIRADLGNRLKEEGLTFLRYAGTMVNAPEYRFKNMIGDPDLRPPYRGHWNHYSSNGFGIVEFLKFCEAAAIEPCFAINIYESPADMADMVEYLNGDASTRWGAKRAKEGHPKPYGVKYIEIGNEEGIFNGDDKQAYELYVRRFKLLSHAMKAKDSSLQLISAAWWRPGSPNMEYVFRQLDGRASFWDLHVGGDDPRAGLKTGQQLAKMEKLFNKWNPDTNMKVAVLEENGNKHGIGRALGHATNMNAIRRHSDFVLTSCPANALQPLGQNDNGWDQGQIFFTPDQSFGMPPFYTQKMQATYHLPLRVQSSADDSSLDVTATRSADGDTLMLYVVNTGTYPIGGVISINGWSSLRHTADVYELSGPLNENGVNTVKEPTRFQPEFLRLNIKGKAPEYDFAASSYTTLKFLR